MKTWVSVLAIIGGLFGIGSGFLVTAAGSLFGENEMANDGSLMFWLSALAMILGFTAWKFPKVSGSAIIIIGLLGLWYNGLFYLIGFIFLLISGILAFRIPKKEEAA